MSGTPVWMALANLNWRNADGRRATELRTEGRADCRLRTSAGSVSGVSSTWHKATCTLEPGLIHAPELRFAFQRVEQSSVDPAEATAFGRGGWSVLTLIGDKATVECAVPDAHAAWIRDALEPKPNSSPRR